MFAGATANHALEHGFRTVLVEDASRGVDLQDIESVREKLIRGGAVVVDSADVSQHHHGSNSFFKFVPLKYSNSPIHF